MKYKNLILLFRINFFISAFTFGGGYVVIPMMDKYFVQKYEKLTYEELMNIAAIAQSAPGAIAINLSSLIGYRIADTAGMLISAISAVLPPFLILGAISFFYEAFQSNAVVAAVLHGMEAGVCCVIVDFLMTMIHAIYHREHTFFLWIILLSFLLIELFQLHVVLVMLIGIASSFLFSIYQRRCCL